MLARPSLNPTSTSDKVKSVAKELYTGALAIGTVAMVPQIPYVGDAVGPILQTITDTAGRGAALALTTGVSRSVTPWDPSSDIIAGPGFKTTMLAYAAKYSLKAACLTGVSYGVNYLNETFVKPLLGNDPVSSYANDALVIATTQWGSQALEAGAIKLAQVVSDRQRAAAELKASVMQADQIDLDDQAPDDQDLEVGQLEESKATASSSASSSSVSRSSTPQSSPSRSGMFGSATAGIKAPLLPKAKDDAGVEMGTPKASTTAPRSPR